ncbi:NlpC/P60 family protein [Anaeromyxobacter terrae]|uniref:NlpC/P60 family protein n=1 Tax=Anaeromyxobacter terrae TaxID=2925406 RepID=UPI001F598F57|nr:NlpC/P60 family protein [Anaeromyxobacter sp. SG22]
MAPARSAALALLALAACAGPGRAGRNPFADDELPVRLAGRAASLVGHAGRFEVGGARLNADCSGFVQAVYEAEGVPLLRLVATAAPGERSGVAGLFRAMERYGTVFGGGGAWPAPGDLVFFHDTYDRNRNGTRDDRFTHVGVVERVEHGTVVFLHRGGSAVVRGVMTPDRPLEPADGDRVLNSAIRQKTARGARVDLRDTALAGALFAGYARLDPRRIPAELQPGR